MNKTILTACMLTFLFGLAPTVGAQTFEDICADADNDEVVDVRDALMVLRHSVDLPSPCSTNLPACDVNGTGDINVADAIDVLRQVVGYTFEMACPFPAVIHVANASGTTPIGGLDLTLTYPASKSEIMSNCNWGANNFSIGVANATSSTQTITSMINIPSVVLPADVVTCEGYGQSNTLTVTQWYGFDDLFVEVPLDVVVVPNLPVVPE